MSCRAFILAGVLLAGGPTYAADTNAPAAQPKKERLVCKTENEIGSRLRQRKTCRTKQEWAEFQQQQKLKTEEIQRMGLKCGPPLSC